MAKPCSSWACLQAAARGAWGVWLLGRVWEGFWGGVLGRGGMGGSSLFLGVPGFNWKPIGKPSNFWGSSLKKDTPTWQDTQKVTE